MTCIAGEIKRFDAVRKSSNMSPDIIWLASDGDNKCFPLSKNIPFYESVRFFLSRPAVSA